MRRMTLSIGFLKLQPLQRWKTCTRGGLFADKTHMKKNYENGKISKEQQ